MAALAWVENAKKARSHKGNEPVLESRLCFGSLKASSIWIGLKQLFFFGVFIVRGCDFSAFFPLKQSPFSVYTARIAGQQSIGAQNAMTGNHKRDRIGADRLTNRLRRHSGHTALCGDRSGDIAVRRRLTKRNGFKNGPAFLLKQSALRREFRPKIRVFPRKVEIQPFSGLFKYRQILI